MTLREAARALGISKEAVRKRVKRGTLAHETGEDGRVYVYLPAGGDSGTDAGGDAPDQQSEKSSAQNAHLTDQDEEPTQNFAAVSESKDERDERIAELQETVRDLRERLDHAEEAIREHLDHAEEANRENRRIIAGLIERLPPQLEPPRDEPGATETGAEASEGASPRSDTVGAQTGAQGSEETASRPWWIRIFGGS
ncbi:MAG: hypothetical protein M3Q49_17585 [Actinomycetota bacterium]|nr:hypothetical protein [Actinomycetota bacterium]